MRLRTALLAVGGTALGYQALVPWLPGPVGFALSDALIAAAVGWAAVQYANGAKAEVGRARAAMSVGSIAAGGWSIANLLDLIGDLGPVPTLRELGNIVSLAAAVGLPLGLILLAPPVPVADRFRRFIDVASVAGAGFALAWLYVLQPGMEATGNGMPGPYATWLTIPEVIAAALSLVIMSDNLPSRSARAPRLLGSAAVVLAGTALMALRNAADNRPWYHAGVGAGYLLAAGLLMLASAQPALRPDPAGVRRHISGGWAALPYVPIILAVVAAAMQQLRAGELRPVFVWVLLTTFSLVLLRQFLTMRIVARQADELERQQAALAYQAHHDALTGLPNRAAFHRRGSALLASSPGVVMVMLLDLDGFKPVNDRFGHAAGDEVLMTVARRLEARLRTTDLVARIGGDEFAMLLTRVTSEAEGLAVAERLLRDIIEPISARGVPVNVGGSIGITSGSARDSLTTLLREADAAMYSAKLRGKGTVHRFENSVGALPRGGDVRYQPGNGAQQTWNGEVRQPTWHGDGRLQTASADGWQPTWHGDRRQQTAGTDGRRVSWTGDGRVQQASPDGRRVTWSADGQPHLAGADGQSHLASADGHQVRPAPGNGDGRHPGRNGNGGAHSL